MTSPARLPRPSARLLRNAAAFAAVALIALSGCSSDDDSTTPTLVTVTNAPGATGGTAVTTAAPTTTAASSPTSPTTPTTVQPGAISDDASTTVPAAGDTTETPPATESVTAPSTTGDINQVVEAPPQETLPAVDLTDPVAVGQSQLNVVNVERIDGQARLPGETAGPALAIHLKITNNGAEPIDLSTVTVNLYDATGAPAAVLTAAPAQRFVGELASSQSAEGVYVFEFANDRPQPVTIEVSPSVGEPIAVFGGNIG